MCKRRESADNGLEGLLRGQGVVASSSQFDKELGIGKGIFEALGHSKGELGLAHTSQPSRTTDRYGAAVGRPAKRLRETANLGFTPNEVGNKRTKLVQALDGGSGRWVYILCDITSNVCIAPAIYVASTHTAHNNILWL
jgi:hypothetical protein